MSTKLRDLFSWHSLRQSTTLFEASAFRATIRFFALLSLIYLASIVLSGSFLESFSKSSHPAGALFEVLKRPVITFGLSLPIIALIANHHRSIQSERQLKTTQEQNIFTNYVKHIEKFNEFLKEERVFQKLEDLNVSSKDLYHRIYSEAVNGELKPSLAFQHRLRMLRNKINEIEGKLRKMGRQERRISPEAIRLMDSVVRMLGNNLCFTVAERECDLSKHSSFVTIFLETQELCQEIEKCTSFIFPSNCSEELRGIGESLMRICASLQRSLMDST